MNARRPWTSVGLLALFGACAPDVGSRAPLPSTPPPTTMNTPGGAVASAQNGTSPQPAAGSGRSLQGATVAMITSAASASLAVLSDDAEPALRLLALDGTPREMAHEKLTSRPGEIVVLGNGRIVVTLREEGMLAEYKVEGTSLERVRAVATDPDARRMALAPDESALAVVAPAAASVSLVDVKTLATTRHVVLPRSPGSVVFDHRVLRVAHTVGALLSTVALDGGEDATSESVKLARADLPTAGPLPMLQISLASFDRPVLTGLVVMTGDSSVRTKDSYGNVGVTSVPPEQLRAAWLGAGGAPKQGAFAPVADRALDHAGLSSDSCTLPQATLADAAGGWLYIACTGPGRLYRLPVTEAAKREDEWTTPVRIPEGVTGLALRSGTLAAWSPRTATLALVDTRTRARDLPRNNEAGGAFVTMATEVRLPRRELPDAIARGQDLFFRSHDRTISSDGRACASCHIEGGDDGLVWPTPEGPRQTPMLAGRLEGTAPYGWSGKRPTPEEHMKETVKRLGGSGLPDADRAALRAYLAALPPPVRARPDAALVARGALLFASPKTECRTCHTGALTADGLRHDVQSKAKGDAAGAFDTPSLLRVGQSARYFHDGRYADLQSMLAATEGKMGHTKHLPPSDAAALIAYLSSL